MGTGLGIFWIDFMCKPATKMLLKHPLVLLLILGLIYTYIGYTCMKSAWQSEH